MSQVGEMVFKDLLCNLWISSCMKNELCAGTFKMKKTRLQNEGYDISRVKDPIYFFHGGKFVPLDKELFEKINLGKIRL
jgi:hypothetical protein